MAEIFVAVEETTTVKTAVKRLRKRSGKIRNLCYQGRAEGFALIDRLPIFQCEKEEISGDWVRVCPVTA